MDLLSMSDETFEERVQAAQKHQQRIIRLVREVMKEGVHYGSATGDPKKGDAKSKPALLKAGAEEALLFFGLSAIPDIEQISGDGESTPHVAIVARVEVKDAQDHIVCVGYGGANSFEKKFRYRSGKHKCPSCGESTVIKGKAEYGGGYFCFGKIGGCGAKFRDEQFSGGAEKDVNPDPWDLQNNLIKYAEKRAKIDAVLSLGLSAYFTQDVEEIKASAASVGERKTGYALPDSGGSIPVSAAPTATTDPLASYVPKDSQAEAAAKAGIDWTGDEVADIQTAARAIGERLGTDWQAEIEAASSFIGRDGARVPGFRVPQERHGKRLSITLKTLKKRLAESALATQTPANGLPF